MTTSGIQLALLEGMDEALLVRLHEAGITTRDALEAALALPADRRALAERLGVAVVRLEALHHLNFVLPEQRVARLLDLEQESRRAAAAQAKAMRGLRVALAALAVALVVVAGVVLTRGPSSPAAPAADATAVDSLRAAVSELGWRVEALTPLARAQARADLQTGLAQLGPAPGWNGRVVWPASRHRRVEAALSGSTDTLPERAASLALRKLAELEDPVEGRGTPLEHARRAADLLADFPDPGIPTDTGTAAAVSVRSRLRARALGLAPVEDLDARATAALPWTWTTPEFAQCEILVARLEALPVQEDALPLWSESLAALRRVADRGRDALGERPEAWARHYWLRRGELEMAVVCALLGLDDLAPYHGTDPRGFLEQRTAFLRNAVEEAPGTASPPLRWLLAEHEEARLLLEWLAGDPGRAAGARGVRWVEALDVTEKLRAADGIAPDAGVTDAVTAAVRDAGSTATDVYDAGRTRWEASLRPLLMATRAAAPPPSATSPGS